MKKELKTWVFIYEDHIGNELKRSELLCFDKREADDIAFQLFASSRLNDLGSVRAQFVPIKWARKCSATGLGMDEGYCFGYGEAYFINEGDALEYANSIGYDNLDDAHYHDAYYYTEWSDDYEYEEDENGVLTYIGN